MVRHLLAIRDLDQAAMTQILDLSEAAPARLLDGQGAALYFEKPSARTRNSMEMAVVQLGGHPIYLQPQEIGIGSRECVEDVTRTLACYHRIIAARVFDHGLLERMAEISPVPVLNMLSSSDHPLQALADLLTIRQHFGRIAGIKVAFIGEANNVSRSLAEACALMGATFAIASPAGHGFSDGTPAEQFRNPSEAVAGADVVCTDVWVSMGGEDTAERQALFRPFQVDEALMARSNSAIFLHCLPARRGEEVSDAVIDGASSAVWKQAQNRMHSARGALQWLVGNKT